MDISLFDDFRAKLAQGRRREAATALDDFIGSFETSAEKQQFTRWLLAQPGGERAASRHELRSEVVLPVLLEGYARGDAWSTYWLAMIGAGSGLTGGKSKLDLLKDCLSAEWEPARVRGSLLAELLRGFEYAVHEWPAGILWGANGATGAQCHAILSDIELARGLDIGGKHAAFLNDFEDKVRSYLLRGDRRPSAPEPSA
jgi:hypothetical protein